ncbi:MAG: hypothetical protein PHW13_05845 [Methylococcales bacterium]|nr:hypothetical protein [Methylococcales bacterium]
MILHILLKNHLPLLLKFPKCSGLFEPYPPIFTPNIPDTSTANSIWPLIQSRYQAIYAGDPIMLMQTKSHQTGMIAEFPHPGMEPDTKSDRLQARLYILPNPNATDMPRRLLPADRRAT